ncbi:Nn.00g088760.m01.CDS01 [Neocucurbitaria sp. VM-36]
MSKGNSDGDVIANRMSLVEAKGQKFLASLLGPQTEPSQTSNGGKDQDEDEDLKSVFGHDRLGVGGILPKDIEDGSFTRRIPTSNDKLLEQLIGKKRAKAHLAAKQEAARPNANAQRHGKPAITRKEESEDEEEGRASAFKSKRRKGTVQTSVTMKNEGSEDENEDEESRTKRLKARQSDEVTQEAVKDVEIQDEQPEAGEEAGIASVSKKVPSRTKAKPTSFLDEILAERTKKKNKKNKS